MCGRLGPEDKGEQHLYHSAKRAEICVLDLNVENDRNVKELSQSRLLMFLIITVQSLFFLLVYDLNAYRFHFFNFFLN